MWAAHILPAMCQVCYINLTKKMHHRVCRQREIMLFIGKPKGRSMMISNATNPLSLQALYRARFQTLVAWLKPGMWRKYQAWISTIQNFMLAHGVIIFPYLVWPHWQCVHLFLAISRGKRLLMGLYSVMSLRGACISAQYSRHLWAGWPVQAFPHFGNDVCGHSLQCQHNCQTAQTVAMGNCGCIC